jgi:hypothetical protein
LVQSDNTTQRLAFAIEDLLFMNAINLEHNESTRDGEPIVLSSHLSVIMSRLIYDMNSKVDDQKLIRKLIYHSLLIYMNDQLRIPKRLMMAFSNDLEKYGDSLECSELISDYLTVIENIFYKQRDNELKN